MKKPLKDLQNPRKRRRNEEAPGSEKIQLEKQSTCQRLEHKQPEQLAESLATIGRAAPALQVAAVAYDAYQIGRNVEKDRRRGTSRNTVKKVTTTVSAYGEGIGGAVAGAAIGTAIFPGVGTIVGGIVGGLTGGIGSAIGSDKAAEVIMDKAEYDSQRRLCRKCQKTFLWRKYEEKEEEEEEICEECREEDSDEK